MNKQADSSSQTASATSRRGKLRIFFGSAPGVGKTYHMLDAAQIQHRQGVNVVIGYIETHQRSDTEPLLDGLPMLPLCDITSQGMTFHEFDLDGALKRHPDLILIDELAHKNPPESRHKERWQDVNELLDAGINVYTTLNVQHLESLTDVIAHITGIKSQETVPDSIFEQADQVELVDISPDELLQRLQEGKIFTRLQTEQAAQTFFRRGNLMALRELALRCVANRVDIQMLAYRYDHEVRQVWATTERVLVCIGANTAALRLVRAAKRMANSLHAQWIVAYVETPNSLRYAGHDQDQIARAFRLAEELGGETVILKDANIAARLIDYARERNVGKIIIGKPIHSRWRDLLIGSVVDDLIRANSEIDIYVISGDPIYAHHLPERILRRTINLPGYVVACFAVLIGNVIAGWLFPYIPLTTLMMIYPLEITLVALLSGFLPAVLASVIGIITFDYFFLPPRFSFITSTKYDALQLFVMLLAGFLMSVLIAQVRREALLARRRERRLNSIFRINRDLFDQRQITDIVDIVMQYIREVFHATAVVILADLDGEFTVYPQEHLSLMQGQEWYVARWVYEHRQVAGKGTENLSISEGLYIPLMTLQKGIGMLGVFPQTPGNILDAEQQQLLELFANQVSLAVEHADCNP